jgi:hypothetical protein
MAAPKMVMLEGWIRVRVPPYFGLPDGAVVAGTVVFGGALVVTPGVVVAGAVVAAVPQDTSSISADIAMLATIQIAFFPKIFSP